MEKRAKPKVAGARKEVGVAPVAVIIPVCGEQGAIARVIDALPDGWFERVIVATSDPSNYTADLARKFGATVVPSRGASHDAACRAAIDYLRYLSIDEQPEVVVFLGADFSANPAQLPQLVAPILKKRCDMVIGSRFLKPRPAGAIPLASLIGTKLACFALALVCCQKHTDIAPFRAASWKSLRQMRMTNCDQSFGVEMQMKAARLGLTVAEVPADCRAANKKKSIGISVRSGAAITVAIFRHALSRR